MKWLLETHSFCRRYITRFPLCKQLALTFQEDHFHTMLVTTLAPAKHATNTVLFDQVALAKQLRSLRMSHTALAAAQEAARHSWAKASNTTRKDTRKDDTDTTLYHLDPLLEKNLEDQFIFENG